MELLNQMSEADSLIAGYRKTRQASGWKSSTQQYGLNLLKETCAMQKELREGTWEEKLGKPFKYNERGHTRYIRPMLPKETVMQHSLCENVLLPILRPCLIHDNGASLKGKGISFTRRRLEQHLGQHYRQHGTEGYILIMDFSKYFDNLPHEGLLKAFAGKIPDPDIISLIAKLLKPYEVDVSYSDDPDIEKQLHNAIKHAEIDKSLLTGRRMMRKSMGIGASISQIAGIYYPTPMDTWCKTVMGCKHYGAYMDDRYCIHKSKEFLKKLLEGIKAIAESLGIFINEKKTQIVKLSHGFTWLKTRYSITKTGKIIRHIPHDVIVRQCRKMKKLALFVIEGKLAFEAFRKQYKDWRGDKDRYHAHRTLRNMDNLYRRLQKWITKKRPILLKSLDRTAPSRLKACP